MTKSNENTGRAGYAKILEAWERPEKAGDPIGCAATSFTFAPDFFETECLGRFLGLESAPDDGSAYYVEREEKLAQLICAAALVDQHHVQGSRNLRWDLLSARVPRGILHAKISLLLWSQQARLIIASANLTPDGCRHNHEVFGVLDFFPGSEAPLPVLGEVIDFLKDAASYATTQSTAGSPATQRWIRFLDRVRKATRAWGATQPRGRSNKTRIVAVLSGPQRPNVLQSLKTNWPEAAAPNRAYVISPFFDPPNVPNKPARNLWKLLGARGNKSVQYEVVAEEVDERGRNHLLLHAPVTLQKEHPSDDDCQVVFQALELENNRPLHAKCLWLENRNWAAYMMGSSNFTSAGLGLGLVSNLEANLGYIIHQGKYPKERRALNDGWLVSHPISRSFRLDQEPQLELGQDAPTGDEILLPKQFGEATFGVDSKQYILILATHGSPPEGWALLHESQDDQVIYTESEWIRSGRQQVIRLAWKDSKPPSALRVRLKGSGGCAWWPVNVIDGNVLPPPEELRQLSLAELVAILTSASPLHRALARLLQKRSNPNSPDKDILDPHRRVDTSQFLIPRTRRVTWALTNLRQRLEQPAASAETMHWRMYGPVGVMKFAEAIIREAKSAQERCFLLTELALELARVTPQSAPHCLSRRVIKSELRLAVRELRVQALQGVPAGDPIRRYAGRAFKEASS
jgi:hypothetical protein